MIAETFGHQSRRPIAAGRGVERVRLRTPRKSYAFLAVSAIRPLAVRNRDCLASVKAKQDRDLAS